MTPLKLHLGCGKRYLPGYTHVDLSDYKHIDIKQDVRVLPMLEDESVSTIYASHVFEYFSKVEAPVVLAEWRRVLVLGGSLQLAVPDFNALFDVYNETHDLSLILGPIYGIWEIAPEIMVQHKTGYDFNSLCALLIRNGFKSVQTWDWKEFFTAELGGFDDYSQAYIPHMKKDSGKLISLNVLAIKS